MTDHSGCPSSPRARAIDLDSGAVVRRAGEAAGVLEPVPDPSASAPPPAATGSFAPAPSAEALANWRIALGPTLGLVTLDRAALPGLDAQLAADAVVSALPGVVLGSVARPLAAWIYSEIIDRIPEGVRRPIERDFGLLLDTAISAAGMLAAPLTSEIAKGVARAGLPSSASIDLQPYSQVVNACGETAAAALLKFEGEPVTLGEVDTQLLLANGANLLEDEELRRRGLSVVNGPGSPEQLKAFLAAGYPVMVAVGWANGGGHYVVVSGYDDAAGTLTIANWDDRGGRNAVKYGDFYPNWARRANYMAAVVPQRDHRVEPMLRAGDLRRPDTIYPGLTLTELWLTPRGKVYVEGAYRYVTPSTDLTVRVHFDQSEVGLARQLGGALSLTQDVGGGWKVGLRVEKVSLIGKADDWHTFATAPLAAGASLSGDGFELKATAERGALEASVAADLGRFVSGLGAKANLSVDPDGSYRVLGMISGTW